MRRALALLLLGLSCVDVQSSLQQYCAGHRDECRCSGPECCLSPGTRCEEGQPCCTGTCANGLCPGMRLDAGSPIGGAGGGSPADGG